MSAETVQEADVPIKVVQQTDVGDNTRSFAVQRYCILKASTLEPCIFYTSPPFYVQGISWAVALKLDTVEDHGDNLLMGLYVQVIDSGDPKYSILNMELEIRLINHINSVRTFMKDCSVSFDIRNKKNVGSPKFKFWSDVLDERQGYVRDDALTLEIFLRATPPQENIGFPEPNVDPFFKPVKRRSGSFFPFNNNSPELELAGMTITDRAQNLLDSGIGSDCEFVVCYKEEKRTFKASKLFLAKVSPVFESMFFGQLKEESPVRLEDVNPDVFYQLLQYSYGCKWSLKCTDDAVDMFHLADRYLMDELKLICLKTIWPENENDMWVPFMLAIYYNLTEIKMEVIKIICERSQQVFDHPKFLELSCDCFITILQQRNLSVSSELEVFRAAQRWATYQCETKGLPVSGENLREQLGTGLDYIRFLSMTIEEFAEAPTDSEILTPTEVQQCMKAIVHKNKYMPPPHLCSLRKKRG